MRISFFCIQKEPGTHATLRLCLVGVGRLELPASASQMPRATNCAIPRMLYFCVIFHDNHVWLLYHSFHKLSRYSSAIMHGLPFYTFLSNLITAKRDHAIRMIPNFKNKKDHDFAQTALHFISKCANVRLSMM